MLHSKGIRKPFVRKLNALKSINQACKYLEIGVKEGKTLFNIDCPYKVAIDPNFAFPVNDARKYGVVSPNGIINKDEVKYFSMTSDYYFQILKDAEIFDLILIDGLHTYDQTYRDLCNCLLHSHSKTFIIVDDIIPCDKFALKRDKKECNYIRKIEEPGSQYQGHWQGDVFKLILFINLFHQNLEYSTILSEDDFPQLILWKEPRSLLEDKKNQLNKPFKKFKNNEFIRKAIESIDTLEYDWIQQNISIFQLCKEEELLLYLHKINNVEANNPKY